MGDAPGLGRRSAAYTAANGESAWGGVAGDSVAVRQQQFKRMKGCAGMMQVFATIEAEHVEPKPVPIKKTA